MFDTTKLLTQCTPVDNLNLNIASDNYKTMRNDYNRSKVNKFTHGGDGYYPPHPPAPIADKNKVARKYRNPKMHKYILATINDTEHKLLDVLAVTSMEDIEYMLSVVYPESRYDVNVAELDVRTHHKLLDKLKAINFINTNKFVESSVSNVANTLKMFADAINTIDAPTNTYEDQVDNYMRSPYNYLNPFTQPNYMVDIDQETENDDFYGYLKIVIKTLKDPRRYWSIICDIIGNNKGHPKQEVVNAIWAELDLDKYTSCKITPSTVNDIEFMNKIYKKSPEWKRYPYGMWYSSCGSVEYLEFAAERDIYFKDKKTYEKYLDYVWAMYISTYGEIFAKEDNMYYDVGQIKNLEYQDYNSGSITTSLSRAYNNGLNKLNNIIIYLNNEFENYGYINLSETGLTVDIITLKFPEIEIIGNYMINNDIIDKIDELCNAAYDTVMLNTEIEKLIHDTQYINSEVSFINLKRVIEESYNLDDDKKKCVRFGDLVNKVIAICGYKHDKDKLRKVEKILPSVLYSMKLRKKRLSSGVHWYGMELKPETKESSEQLDNYSNYIMHLNDLPMDTEPVAEGAFDNKLIDREKEDKNIRLNLILHNTASIDDYNDKQNAELDRQLSILCPLRNSLNTVRGDLRNPDGPIDTQNILNQSDSGYDYNPMLQYAQNAMLASGKNNLGGELDTSDNIYSNQQIGESVTDPKTIEDLNNLSDMIKAAYNSPDNSNAVARTNSTTRMTRVEFDREHGVNTHIRPYSRPELRANPRDPVGLVEPCNQSIMEPDMNNDNDNDTGLTAGILNIDESGFKQLIHPDGTITALQAPDTPKNTPTK